MTQFSFAFGALSRLALLVLGLGAGAAGAQEMRFVTFGAASLSGNYYAIARGVCGEVNRARKLGVRCSPEPTPGSLYNLFALQRGELDFALVQSDWQHLAVNGWGPFSQTGAMGGLRGVMTLYHEALTLVARRDSGIAGLDDLAGKVVDIGHPSTGRRGTNNRLLAALDLPEDHFAAVRELSGPAVVSEICSGGIDATLIVFGHPNDTVRQAMAACDLVLVPVTGPKIDAFLGTNTDYTRYVIPAFTYPGMTEPVATFSVAATLVTREDIEAEVVELIAATILREYRRLQQAAPVLPDARMEAMQADGMTAPLHPGAAAAFAAAGG